MSNKLLLPSSLLRDRSLGSVLYDWPLPDGTTTRIECATVYCANCGKACLLVPRDNTSFMCYLCNPCFDKYGAIAGTYAVPDDEFNQAVSHELAQKAKSLGLQRPLTVEDIAVLADRGELGSALEKLEKESPYPVWNGH
jgi:hypothetical protein